MSGSDLKKDLANLAAVKVPQVPEGKKPEDQAKLILRKEKESLDLASKAQDIAHRDREMGQREKYAFRVFLLVVGWICAIFLLLLLQGFGSFHGHPYHPLSDKVLLTLITSTTVNIIATLILVLKYLFRMPSSKKP